MKSNSLYNHLTGGCAVLALAVSAGSASAQENVTVLETITVSGENLERSVRQTASSIAVMTDDDIQRRFGDESVLEAVSRVPNVTVPAEGGLLSAPTIRGQASEGPNSGATAFFSGTTPRTAVEVDGRTLNFNELIFGFSSLWDVESIEVYRGPQTISQGANSIAGAVIIDTKDPTFEPEFRAQTQYGSYDRFGAAMVASGPLSDQVAGRVAIDYNRRDTFIDYVAPGFQSDGDLDLDSFNGRGKLLFVPDALPGFEAKITGFYSYNNRPTFEAASPPYDDLDNITPSNPTYENNVGGGMIDISYLFDNGMKFYNELQYNRAETDRTATPAENGSASIEADNVSNETRLIFGDPDVNGASGVVGAYLGYTASADELSLTDRLGNAFVSNFDDDKQNMSIFGEVNYRFLDRWVASGSLRYQHDRIQREGLATFGRGERPLDYDETFDALLPKLSLAYDLTEDVTVGALVSRGYNPGGVSLDLVGNQYYLYDEETVWNYELFARTSLLDDRLRINANVFYSDFEDAQRYVEVGQVGPFFQSYTVNVEDARSYGLEVGAEYDVRSDLRVQAGLGLLSTEIKEIGAAAAGISEGNDFSRAPNYTLSFGFDWDIRENLSFGASLRHSDGYFSDDANSDDLAVGSYTVVDLRAAFSPQDNFKAFAYVNNLFDDRSATLKRQNRASGGFVEASIVQPREIGAGLQVSF
ncbi:TonB-dependent receptor [Notoacmeibacter ruber]|uniref:TonB-dependent receptor n=1 Tax=Notoacmeibacter ruber TaxID=2670375 RepID=A0A3L7J420_9HYPH|nr:TonB-dependent receptor [Notoacmeibacter ruber]RLQ85220.1 TonB-dependent receptor [Notoacmeibacter ruber]